VDAYYPHIPEEKNSVASLILSALVHLFFIGALFLGIQWKRQTGDTVAVALWGSGFPGGGGGDGVPEIPSENVDTGADEPLTMSAPPEFDRVENKTPVVPDITYQESDKDKKNEKQPAPERDTPMVAPRRNFSRELNRELREQRRAAQEKELRSILANANPSQESGRGIGSGSGSGGGSGSGTGGGIGSGVGPGSGGGGAGVAGYQEKIRMKIRGNILLPAGIPGNPEAVFRVTQIPSGEIMKVVLVKSSAYAPLDEAVERAILKSSPLPKPDNPAHFERDLRIPYRPYP
jgi:colicin import membrane protein